MSGIMSEHVPSHHSELSGGDRKAQAEGIRQAQGSGRLSCLIMAAEGPDACPHRRNAGAATARDWTWALERSAIAGRIGFRIRFIGARSLVHITAWLDFRTPRGQMTELPIDKRERYVGYATCCLQIAKTMLDGQTRTTLREMASEWLKLAEHAYD
jgi:hypothetical protein